MLKKSFLPYSKKNHVHFAERIETDLLARKQSDHIPKRCRDQFAKSSSTSCEQFVRWSGPDLATAALQINIEHKDIALTWKVKQWLTEIKHTHIYDLNQPTLSNLP